MDREYILDTVVREALKEAGLGEFSRSTFFGRREDDEDAFRSMMESLGRGENAKIKYALGNTLTIVGDCVTTLGIRKKSDPRELMTEEGVKRYQVAAKKQTAQEDAQYRRELAAWKKKDAKRNPAFRNIAPNIGRPLNSHAVEVYGAEAGVLVDSYKDKDWFTAQFERVVIQYVHPDAIMNLTNHRQTTDLTGEALLKVMTELKARYDVETGYLNGKELRDSSYGGGIGGHSIDQGPEDKEFQNNVFQKEFKGTATVDNIVTAVRNVYAAGEAFKAGIYRMREEKITKHNAALKAVMQNF